MTPSFHLRLFLLACLAILPYHSATAQTTVQETIAALKDSLSVKNGGDRVLVYKDLAVNFRSVNPDSAQYYTDLGLEEAIALDDDYYQARMWLVQGILRFDAGHIEEAMAYYQQTIPVFEASNEPFVLGSVYANISNAYDREGKYNEAIAAQIDALKYFEQTQDTVWIAGAYLNLGNRYLQINQESSSLEYYKKALVMFESIGNAYFGAICANSMAAAYLNQGQLDKAITYAKQSVAGYQSIGVDLDQCYPLTTLAMAHRSLGDLEQAESYFLKALTLTELRMEKTTLLFLKNDIAQVQLEMGKVNQAKVTISEAYTTALEINFLPAKEALSKTMAQVYQAEGNYSAAYTTLQLSTQYKDTLNLEENKRKAMALREQFESEQKENEILRQRNELIENELTLKQRNLLLLAGGGLVVVILVVGIALLRFQRLKTARMRNKAALERALAEAQAQEKLKEQRLRIARDLHDNIGSQLTYIISLADTTHKGVAKGEAFLAEKLTQMKQFTIVTITELRDTIWAMNKEELSLADIQERIQQLAATIHEATDDGIRVTTEGTLSHRILSAFVGMNLFRIIQECINNAVKHAATEEITVTFQEDGEEVQVVIQDFGKGFYPQNLSAGNGLYIMKNRADKANITFDLSSTVGVGTQVTLRVQA